MMGNFFKLKNILLVLFVLISITLSCYGEENAADVPVASSAPINPEYLKYLERVNALNETGEFALGYEPPVISFDHLIGKRPFDSNVQDLYPSSYDLRTFDKLTPIKNQNPWGTCWAFGSLASLESSLKPNQTYDFSEKHVVNRNLWLTGPKTGGNYLKSGGYLVAWMGPVNETTDPYPVDTWNYTSPSGPVTKHVQEIYWIPGMANASDLETIKSSIVNNGALISSFYWNPASYNFTHKSYYCPTCSGSNHCINLVGWDDNYNRNNFTTPAPGDGAFLLRNSWGTSWGDQGYGWISYHDPTIGKYNAHIFGSDVNDYSGIYQYDPAGTSSYIGIPSTSIWGGNIFTATADENLTAVGFYTNDVSASYDVRVYKNPTAGGPVGSTILSQKTGTIPMSGYHTISLDTPVFLSVGDIFSIVVHLTNPSYGYPLAVENPASGPIGNTWSANPGEGYVSSDGNSWTDIVTIPGFVNTSICIKGYTNTITPPPVANFTSNVTTGLVPLTVQFTDTSTGSPTSWLWNFGEGNTSSSQNPVHTYTTAGLYTVNLTASNAGGSDTRVAPGYINVTNPVPLPPVASFTSNVTSGDIPLCVQFNDTSTGNPTSFYWTFGDGANTTIRNPIHTYETPGLYTVTLSVANSAGSNLTSKAGYINATSPLPNPFVTGIYPNFTKAGMNVGFNLTGNYFSEGSIVNLTMSGYCNITTFGNLSGSNLTGFFDIPSGTATGMWNVSVNRFGQYSNDNVQFQVLPPVPPVASFIGIPRTGLAPLFVQFADTSTGGPTSWSWSFGDGGLSTDQHPSHTYSGAGLYTVSLNVSNSGGSNVTTAPGYINVTSSVVPPVASFTGSPRTGVAPLSVQFTDSSTGNPTTWNWNFGDGLSSTMQNPIHTYAGPGQFTVNLTVSNTAGTDTLTAPDYISVSGPPSHYSINASSGPNGRIDPSGLIIIPAGGNQRFSMISDTGYQVGDVLVDQVSVGPVGWYEFRNISTNHTISVNFERIPGQKLVNASANRWSIVYPPGISAYQEGTNCTYITQAKPGAEMKQILIDSVEQNLSEFWTFTNISDDHNIYTYSEPIPDQIHVFFRGAPSTGSAPLGVQFIDESIGTPTSWLWQFGDGEKSYDQNPYHEYQSPGIYTVTLRAYNGKTGGYGVWSDGVIVK